MESQKPGSAIVSGDESIVHAFDRVALSAVAKAAIVTEHRSWTYGEVQSWSNRVARILADRPKQLPIALMVREPQFLIGAMYGVWRAGGFFVVLDPAYPGERIDTILESSGAQTIITSDSSAESVPNRDGRREVVRVSDIEALDDSLIEPPIVGRDAIMQIIYTSGSTGRPKGIITPHARIERWYSRERSSDLSPDDRVVPLFSSAFAAASSTIHQTLLRGASLYPYSVNQSTLLDLARWLIERKITVYASNPSLFRQLMASVDPNTEFPSIRLVKLGGDVVTPADIELFKKRFAEDCRMSLSFSSSEAGRITRTFIDRETRIDGPLVSLGKPVSGQEVRLLDEAGTEVPVGSVGEIVVTALDRGTAYWRDPDLTARTFLPAPGRDGFRTIFTGDLGKFDLEGNLYFVGRKDSQIKVRGNRVEAGEIESVLQQHPAVGDAAVVAPRLPDGEPLLTAWVTVRSEANAKEIREWLSRKLPEFMVPARIGILERMPLTPNGKVDRKALEAMEVGTHRPAGRTEARDDFERRIREIWLSILHRDDFGLDDHFFDVGGNSLLAARVFAEIEKAFGRDIPVAALIEAPTIATQACVIRDGGLRHARDFIVPIRTVASSRPNLFCVPGGGGGVLGWELLARHLPPDQPVFALNAVAVASFSPPETLEQLASIYIDAIRSVQPGGPYFLTGHSIGGIIAWEMARQLTAAGQSIALLALQDTAADAVRVSVLARVTNRLRLLLRDPVRNIPRFTREYAHRFLGRRRLRREVQELNVRDDIPSESVLAAKMNGRLHRAYRLEPWDGRAVLLRARDGMRTVMTDPHLGWSSLARAGIDVRDVPGDHFTMLRHPDVEALGHALDLCIQEGMSPEADSRREHA